MEFNKTLEKFVPYTVSQRVNLLHEEDWLLLDWNESTRGINQKLKAELIEFVSLGKFNLYGDVECKELRDSIAVFLGISNNQISIFNGSDSALNILIESIISVGENILMSNADYSQIKTFVSSKGGEIVEINYEDVFDATFEELDKYLHKVKAFYFSNPNNPTGVYWDYKFVEKLISSHKEVWFIIDEAYVEFVDKKGMLDLINKYNNVFILRTFSKAFGLAGLRVGYLISQSCNLEVINKIRNGKEVSSIGQFAANRVVNDYLNLNSYVDEINLSRDFILKEIEKIPNIKSFNSSANFILIKSDDCKKLFDHLFENKILVRDRSQIRGLENCLRITLGSITEMRRVADVLKLFYKI